MHTPYEGLFPGLLLPSAWDPVAAFLTGNAWKATVILMIGFGAASLLRRASASFRHLVWSATIICLMLLPLASLALPIWSVALPAGSEMGWAVAAGPVSEPVGTVSNLPITPNANANDQVAPKPVDPGISSILIAIWAMGFGLVASRLWIGVRRVSAMTRAARELETRDWSQVSAQLAARLPLRRPVALLRSEHISIPMTAGFRRPVILLPKDAEEWPAERRSVVLAHELLHVQRADYCLWMLARLVLLC